MRIERKKRPVEARRAAPFVVLEGLDGAGTTTQATLLARWLRDRGEKVVQTREPTPGPIGSLIRQVMSGRLVVRQGDEYRAPCNGSIALLFAADRLDHCDSLISPALSAGSWVLSDRYRLSSMAYQSVQDDSDWVREINSRSLKPDLTVFLEISAEEGSRRRGERGVTEIYDETDFQRRVRDSYHRAMDEMRAAGEELVVLDGEASIEEVASQIREAVAPLCQ